MEKTSCDQQTEGHDSQFGGGNRQQINEGVNDDIFSLLPFSWFRCHTSNSDTLKNFEFKGQWLGFTDQ